MPDPQRNDHVPVDEIADYLEGKLPEEQSRRVGEHLERCVRCGLEAKRLERFMRIDSDSDLARRAEWLYARGKLEKAYKERIAPSSAKSPSRAERRALSWLMPVAAVAAAVLLIVRFAAREEPARPEVEDVMRGAPPVQYEIALETPLGEIAGAPASFSWRSARAGETYSLEVFSPSLERVYAAGGITAKSFPAPDSLSRILKPNVVYLWSVTGTIGLERPSSSPNGWFKYSR